ncbi:MAG: hypothetical protein V3S80_01815 [Sulfurimonadaceae bacterium]|jgi:hypothetical protein
MNNLPQDATKISVEGSTVDFYTYMKENTTYYQFDTSMTGPPEPMVNAMAGLNLIDSADKKLVMINHKSPGGLISKIGENYNIEEEAIGGSKVKLVFSYKSGASEEADLSDNSCH